MLPNCNRLDCFANVNNGKCKCLNCTIFYNKDGSKRECPFYKSIARYKSEIDLLNKLFYNDIISAKELIYNDVLLKEEKEYE